MNIAVCVCQVPEITSVIGFVDETIDISRVNTVINPYDEYALEEAVRFKEHFEGSCVTVFSVAPVSAKEMLRKTLSMGADRAVLVSDSGVSDPFQTAQALCLAISDFYKDALPDLIFCGKHSTDFQSAQVPPMLSELLGIVSVSAITKLTASTESIKVERAIEGGIEYIEVTYPVLFSAEKGLNIPRKTSIRAVMDAKKKPINLFSVTLSENAYVVMTSIVPLERKKICTFVSDEKELIQLLTEKHILC